MEVTSRHGKKYIKVQNQGLLTVHNKHQLFYIRQFMLHHKETKSIFSSGFIMINLPIF